MTKAEQKALKAYPDQSHDLLHTPSWRYERNIYVKGYEQAEKDIKSLLIKKIRKIAIWNTIKVGKKEIRDIVTEIIESI